MMDDEKWDEIRDYNPKIEKFGNCVNDKHTYLLKSIYIKYAKTGILEKIRAAIAKDPYYVPKGSTGKQVFKCKNCGLELMIDREWE